LAGAEKLGATVFCEELAAGLTSSVFGDGTYKFGADVVSTSPDYLVRAILGGLIAVEQQDKLVEHLDSINVKSNTFRGDIGYQAEARLDADPELDGRQSPQAVAWAPASFFKVRQVHCALLHVVGRAFPLQPATASSAK